MSTAYLLDTNVVSELRKKHRCHPNVAGWQARIAGEPVFISAIAMMEIRHGILSARRKDPEFSEILERWYQMQVKPSFHNRVLPVNLAIAERCAVFLSHRTHNLADALIAATSAVHGLVLATRNTSDFADTGIALVDPWE